MLFSRGTRMKTDRTELFVRPSLCTDETFMYSLPSEAFARTACVARSFAHLLTPSHLFYKYFDRFRYGALVSSHVSLVTRLEGQVTEVTGEKLSREAKPSITKIVLTTYLSTNRTHYLHSIYLLISVIIMSPPTQASSTSRSSPPYYIRSSKSILPPHALVSSDLIRSIIALFQSTFYFISPIYLPPS